MTPTNQSMKLNSSTIRLTTNFRNVSGILNTKQKRKIPRFISMPRLTSRLLEPVVFDASKLTVIHRGDDLWDMTSSVCGFLPRVYTLTHHDVTSELFLSIGTAVNDNQLNHWYTKLLRDEVVAEWRLNGPTGTDFSLHIFCHISGAHFLLAPAGLRDWIFRREMPLVIQAFRYGDDALFKKNPELETATVWVHYNSVHSKYNRADCWGPLHLAAKSREFSIKHVDKNAEIPRTNNSLII